MTHPNPPMRRLVLVLLLAATALSARAADAEFVRVWSQWHPALDFKRISEYFTDHENFSHKIIVRSQPASRAGYYFLARVRHPAFDLAGGKFVLHVITPAGPVAREFTFPLPAECPPGVHVFQLGLTGSDWPMKGTHPVAWRLELLSADGRILVAQQSYLWSKPDK